MTDVSVIIATRNRAGLLPKLFQAFAGLEIPLEVSWELVIVDNASKDDTARVIEYEMERFRLPILHLTELVPGKSRALNQALRKSSGELFVFTDSS